MIYLLLALLADTPIASREIILPWEFNRIAQYNDQIFFASQTGTSIFYYQNDSLKTLTFTTDPLFIIQSFQFTPFFLYLSDGKKIIRNYLQQSLSETIYQGNSITSFSLLESGDIVVLERKPDRILILDRQHQIRLSVGDFPAKDIAVNKTNIFVLTKKDVIIADNHLNIQKKIPLPDVMKRIVVGTDRLFLFAPAKRFIYFFDQVWHKITWADYIQDMIVVGDKIIVLEGYGNIIRVYNFSDF